MGVKLSVVLLLLLLASCGRNNTLFKKLPSSYTGITFNNKIVENDSINPIDLEFLYNGGGVAVGDFNNDGLPDLYFTASTAGNKLYLNKGKLQFTDITDESKATGNNEWCNGASVADVNGDGWLDIYVCATINKNPLRRQNLLYINKGLDKNGMPFFKEMAKEYGLADTGYSVQAAFFDYDNDGDLDMYLLRTRLTKRDATQFSSNNGADTSTIDVDKLYRNDWNDSLKHPVFTDVSAQAGIKEHGYGLGLSIADINNDGWKDIYVTNDFYGNDLLYINNHDGTFTNKASSYFKHTSQNAMGNDVADINNDGQPDVIAVDMAPEDNFRKKKNMNRNNYFLYQSMAYNGYVLQYVRNTLQLNMGPRMLANDSIGDPLFADIGFYAGVAETDWSWNPSIADFDNDGNRDILITNGYPKDVTDHDFAAFRNKAANIATKQQLIDQIPQIKISNYAFKNHGSLKFENKAKEWGLDEPSFSNGAVYVDLDNDGDLDYVVNNINDEAFVYENTLNTPEKTTANYLKISFAGNTGNTNGLGAKATVYYNHGKKQVWENAPVRGYLSCVENTVLFGLGNTAKVDSVIIEWKNNYVQKLMGVRANQLLKVYEKNALPVQKTTVVVNTHSLFTNITKNVGITYQDTKPDFIDFTTQKLLLHKFSEYGPALASADIDGNGYDDICIGGAGSLPVKFLMQQAGGSFVEKNLPLPTGSDVRWPVNMGVLLLDADNDGHEDLYLTSGGDEFGAGSKNYQDRLYENDGKGNFTYMPGALPVNYTSKSCVEAADFNHDGKADLFVGGRVLPGRYPKAVSSFIYRNDSKNGKILFTDVTDSVAPMLKNIGLVCDALWTDFDNDGWVDLIIAGEWMPITFLKNDHGHFVDITTKSGIGNQTGWWNSLAAGDFDNDGDIDYIVGNAGTNMFYRASEQYPVSMYGNDFAHNGGYTSLATLFLPDGKGGRQEYPAQTRDDVTDPLPFLKKKFLTYKQFGAATISDLFPAADLQSADKLSANNMQSCYIENLGNGKFALHRLPWQAQLSPVYGMVADDFNNDGNLDVAIAANDYGAEASLGHADAMNGLVLLGNGRGGFTAQSIAQGGLCIPGNAKALVKLRGGKDNYLLAASQHRGALQVFSKKQAAALVPIMLGDVYAMIYFKDGYKRKEEFYTGSSFLSQSARFVECTDRIKFAEITDKYGAARKVYPK